MKDVLALVVTYNRKDCLLNLLEGLTSQTYKINNILCIDNGSADGTKDVLKSNGYIGSNGFHYFNTNANLGGAGGFNRGFNEALNKFDFDYLWVMDDDVKPEPDCLERMMQHANDNSVLQPHRLHLNGEGATYSSEAKEINFSSPTKKIKSKFVTKLDIENVNELVDIKCFPFEGPLFAKEIVLTTGLPDERFFIQADDTDYSIRVSKAGYEIKLVPTAILKRQLPVPTVDNNMDWKSYFFIRNLIVLDKKHAAWNIYVLRTILRLIRGILANIYHRRNFKAYKLLFKAVKDAVLGSFENNIDELKRL